MPSKRPVSGLGGACSLSMDHFSMMDDTWGLSIFSSRNPVMFTPLYLYSSRSKANKSCAVVKMMKVQRVNAFNALYAKDN